MPPQRFSNSRVQVKHVKFKAINNTMTRKIRKYNNLKFLFIIPLTCKEKRTVATFSTRRCRRMIWFEKSRCPSITINIITKQYGTSNSHILTSRKINFKGESMYTLNLDGVRQQNRSNSCDDLASSSKVVALFPQSLSSRAFEPAG